jgi:hypothetical protein
MEYEIDESDSDCWTMLDSDCLRANDPPQWLFDAWDAQTGVLIPEETRPAAETVPVLTG